MTGRGTSVAVGIHLAPEADVLHEGILAFALLGAEWVLWVLVALSLGCFAISIERAVFLLRDGTDRSALGAAVNAFFAGGSVDEFRERLSKLAGFEARVLAAGMEVANRGPDAVEKAMIGTTVAERMRMERGLLFLGTVGSNAPFIGLFGTVLGIIQAFHDLSMDSADATKAVMAGISGALVATAVGLIVAIPAVVLYNLFGRWVRNRLGVSESLAEQVIARISGTPEKMRG
jgi:biopolymer transport protein ExbB